MQGRLEGNFDVSVLDCPFHMTFFCENIFRASRLTPGHLRCKIFRREVFVLNIPQ